VALVTATLGAATVGQLASELAAAYRTRQPVAPLTDRFPELTVDDAYEIQLAQVRQWTANGAEIKGHKVGLTSAAMQEMLGIDQPDYGHLRDDMFHADKAEIPLDQFIQLRAEPEIGFVLKDQLTGPGITSRQAQTAIEAIVPALELIDSRIADWRIRLGDTIADNASSGALVLGSSLAPTDIDLRAMACVLRQNGADVETGDGAAVLGNPLNAVVWLANTLGERGIALHAGHLVLPGACTRAIKVAQGDVITAAFDGTHTVTARFV
jgi:2-keto-4-pentenoate hydratase